MEVISFYGCIFIHVADLQTPGYFINTLTHVFWCIDRSMFTSENGRCSWIELDEMSFTEYATWRIRSMGMENRMPAEWKADVSCADSNVAMVRTHGFGKFLHSCRASEDATRKEGCLGIYGGDLHAYELGSGSADERVSKLMKTCSGEKLGSSHSVIAGVDCVPHDMATSSTASFSSSPLSSSFSSPNNSSDQRSMTRVDGGSVKKRSSMRKQSYFANPHV